MELIKCRNVCLAYESNTVLNDLSFSVGAGDYLCVVGENGAGKSTLMKAILGLKSLSGGSISFEGGLLQKEIGYLPQQSGIQRDFPASVYEIVLSGCLNRLGTRLFYNSSDKAIAEKNIKMLGLDKLRKRCYRELSGGQQQRVLLARALCATSKLLLLDEPTAGLDPVVASEFYEIVKNINSQGITIVMVSHDIGSVLSDSDHVLHIYHEGHYFGTTDEYRQSAAYERFARKGDKDA